MSEDASEKTKGKKLTSIIGTSGVGITTMVHYLSGKKIKMTDFDFNDDSSKTDE